MPNKTVGIAEYIRLNAPYGAPCFLTMPNKTVGIAEYIRLNAPYGAPCFLT